MSRYIGRMVILMTILPVLHLSVLPAMGQAETNPRVPAECQRKANRDLGFFPRAITLTSVNVRAQMPEYSLLKGEWVLGQLVDTLPPRTCLAIVEKRMVGVVQIWYLVKYQRDGVLTSGWVWGGTKDVDETRYIGGDTTPERQEGERGTFKDPTKMPRLGSILGSAYAQTDFPPAVEVGQGGRFSLAAGGIGDERAMEYYVKVPLLGAVVSVSFLSGLLLFLAMLLGMLAKAIWDQTEIGEIVPPGVKILRPLLISPIAFSAFWGTMYIQQGSTGLSLTMGLYAFQIGFMWQHVLEKKLATREPEKK